MTIVFIHGHSSFLPEIEAYRSYFEKIGIGTEVMTKSEWQQSARAFDVEWFMMGTDVSKRTSALRIHEYASASTPPLRQIKDGLKRAFNTRPDIRIFQNEYVKTQLGFADDIPYRFRDMGTDTAVLNTDEEKVYDLIYIGTVRPGGLMNTFISRFRRQCPGKALLVLGSGYEALAKKYARAANIEFRGPVPRKEVASCLNRSRFALNLVQDWEPFSRQTSTKFLEYLQQRIPVITSDYPWVREFQARHGGAWYYLDKDLSNLNWQAIETFSYGFPPMQYWSWENRIRESGIIDLILEKTGRSNVVR